MRFSASALHQIISAPKRFHSVINVANELRAKALRLCSQSGAGKREKENKKMENNSTAPCDVVINESFLRTMVAYMLYIRGREDLISYEKETTYEYVLSFIDAVSSASVMLKDIEPNKEDKNL